MKSKESFRRAKVTEAEMKEEFTEEYIRISGLEHFSAERIFDCGQCFRFEKTENNRFEGVAFGKLLRVYQTSDSSVILYCTEEDYLKTWKHFLALDVDYGEIIAKLPTDKTMAMAAASGDGIRILAQDRWETLCSFIISQNNNIPRIKKNINDLCVRYGTPFEHSGKTYYAFPSAKTIAEASAEELTALKLGFRVKYILDAAKRVSENSISFDEIGLSDSGTALQKLCEIKGVGPKVASCCLLFGFGKTDAFPVDVWIKRILDKYYPSLSDLSYFGEYAGIAQQYLFYYERWKPELQG